MVRKQVLKASKFSRTRLLKNQRKENENKLVLNTTYHPYLIQLKNRMTRIYHLLTLGNEHNKVFRVFPTFGFRRTERLKHAVLRAKTPPGKHESWSLREKCPYSEHSVWIWRDTEYGWVGVGADIVKDLDVKLANILYLSGILPHLLQNAPMRLGQKVTCRSKNLVYLISCKTCHKQ